MGVEIKIVPTWNAEEYKTKLFVPVLLLGISILYLYTALVQYQSSNDLLRFFNLFIAMILFIYFIGRVYGEVNSKKDYIEISRDGIRYRETPGLSQGWIPKRKQVKFDEVESVDLVKIRNIFDPENPINAIHIKLIDKQPLVIGSKLSQSQVIKIGLALKGSVVISNTLQRFLKDENQVMDVVETAKEIWNSIKSKENS